AEPTREQSAREAAAALVGTAPATDQAPAADDVARPDEAPEEASGGGMVPTTTPAGAAPDEQAVAADTALDTASDTASDDDALAGEDVPMEVRVAQTLADLQSSTGGAVTASVLKRTLLRKDPTFSEADYGFRTFGEFLRFLADRDFVELATGPSTGDPEVSLPAQNTDSTFELLRAVVQDEGGAAALSGLKNAIRKRRPDFSEKALGYRGFLQFCKAAQSAGAVDLAWDDDADDYLVTVA
ncbi:OST-HTH/LOTUS domain-containing protein, partial [Cellulosimicrobium cellulans]|uniref:OST-HTH/LOTUS domain-containing protein n=1 Tax=Cellulosimicrobium cellulans TaxID=1710 RepID=UPI000B0A63CC